jgi:ADP-heptose:LPS heptosyltransferase
MPNHERTIVLDKRSYSLHWLPLWASAATTLWDLVVDIRGSALAWMVPTRRRAVMRRRPGHKTVQLAAVLDLDPPPLPVAWTAAEDRARAAALLPLGKPIIALGPTANWAPKIWPVERFAALFHALQTGPLRGAIPAVFAGPGEAERALAAPLLHALPDAIDLVGKLSLPEAAACLARCALFVGNDSGLMHLAASAGTPTLGLFGPTPAAEYAPSGKAALVAMSSSARMEDLLVDAAFAAASRLLVAAEAA